jgi:hypothetical protein
MKRAERRELIAEELAALAKRGRLDPKHIVQWARDNRRSVLHSCFQWDDTRAAQQYRLWQARELIVSVEAVYEDGKQRQVYVSPILSRRDGRGYRRLVDVLSDRELRDGFLSAAVAELERTCAKYEDLTELAGVRAAVRLVRVGRRSAA